MGATHNSDMSIEFMRRAIVLAHENIRAGGGPFAAVVVKDGRVIAEGVNRVTAANDPTAHAEIVAIRAACQALKSFQLTDCDLYTSCEPCPCVSERFTGRGRRECTTPGRHATQPQLDLTMPSSTKRLFCRMFRAVYL